LPLPFKKIKLNVPAMINNIVATDVIIIGAGPVGLFAVFELGLLDLKCHVVDVLPKIGGQCAELYPEKPIYDIPALPEVSGQELTDRLMQQAAPFKPVFHLNQLVNSLQKLPNNQWQLTTDAGTILQAPVVVVAAGGGSFTPKKPPIAGIECYEETSVHYAVRNRQALAGHDLVVVGGGDSALDWAINLQPLAKSLTLVHRRPEFRAAPHSVAQFFALKEQGLVKFVQGQVSALHGAGGMGQGAVLEQIDVTNDDGQTTTLPCQKLLPFFGLTLKLGPVADFGLNLHENRIVVDTEKFETSHKGIYAVGDINYYPGKLKLILSGFHEAALMAQAAFKYINPDKTYRFEYTTASTRIHQKLGVQGK
jgi:thioredoxin reductase (NADPH)